MKYTMGLQGRKEELTNLSRNVESSHTVYET